MAVNDYERIGRLIYGLQRRAIGIDALKALRDDVRLPAGLAARAGALAGRVEALLARDAPAVPDEDVEVLLKEAEAVAGLAAQP